MILIKIELISAIHPSRSRELGRLVLTNDGKGTDKRCNYKAELMRRGTKDTVLKSTTIMNYPRHAYTVWELIRRVLQELLKGDVVQIDTGVSEAEYPCTCHNCGNQH